MKAQIVAVGTELLLGQIANTNAQHISQYLSSVGVDVMFHLTVGDNEARIAEVITRGLVENDVVIITGGLGPTHDDLTREAIASATGKALLRDAELETWLRDRFASMGRRMPASNLRQADVPEGAESLPNPIGTAPGIMLEHEGKLIFAVPGVPSEMHLMMKQQVLPRLGATSDEVIVSRVLKATGLGESDLAQRIEPIIRSLDETTGATIALLASFGEVKIRITAKGRVEAAEALITPVEAELRSVLGEAVFGADDDTLESVVVGGLKKRNLTIAIAESFTGGLVTSRLVEVPGVSAHLLAGYVAYSNEAKVRDLGVPQGLIQQHGAVSGEVALAMAEGVRINAGADIGLSTTGEAGPSAKEAQVGTIFLGLAWDSGSNSVRAQAPGGRKAVRLWGAQAALNMLRLLLEGGLE
ncbi:MAG: competence/damage-inducible protein A [Actinomycetota bacterium]